jgi:hypothetical protein
MKTTVRVFHAPGIELEIQKEASIYVPQGEIFFLAAGTSMTTIHAERRRAEAAESKYINLLKGLEYWKARALK